MVKILSVSDVELGIIYSPQIVNRFNDVDLVISCGDLPYYYLEYIISTLDVQMYSIRGNHSCQVEHTVAGTRTYPWGARDLHCQLARHESGLLLGGVEGSVRYNNGPFQYTQAEMWWNVFALVPGMFFNRLRYGRFLDVFVTHAPPWKIHDGDDIPHRGIKAFLWLIRVFQPTHHFHGHTHVYRQDTVTVTRLGQTNVINTYGCRETTLEYPYLKQGRR